ncbi:MAG: hypothetical protein IKW76_09905 [Clostridia bacterium]|nr:hypothetical protein [Clostridia bacterium]
MKKMFERSLSLLLAAIIVYSGMAAALAAPGAQTPQVQASYDLDSTDKVGALLSDAMTDSIPDEAAAYAVTDVKLDGKTATVSLNNSGECTVVVALYTEERGTMLGSGVQKASANAATVKVNIEIAAMPEYFLLKAFLLGVNNEALCPNYTDIEHTKGFEEFDSKTVDDFKDDVVINFDDAKDENFAVLVDGAVQTKDAAHNVLQSYDEKTGKYVFTNIDDTVRTLSAGDIFKSETDETVILLKVKSVSVDGTTATVYEEQDTSYEDFFQFINVDESSYDTEEHTTVNMDYADESVEFVGYSAWDDEPQVGAQSEIEIDGSGKLCPEFKGTKNLVGSGSSTISVVFTYGFKLYAEYELKLFYDLNWKPDFWNSTECLFCQLTLDFKVKGEIGMTGKFQFDLPLTELNYPTPVGIILTAKFDIHFEVSASVTLTIELLSFTIGFRYVEGVGFQNLCKAPQFKFEPKVEAKAEVKLALKPIPSLSFIKVVAAELQPEVGAKATLTLWTFDAMQALGYKMPDKLDTCTQPCFEGVASLYFSCKITGSFFGKTFGDFPIVAELTRKLGDFYVRFNPFSMHWGTCPNLARRVDFTIVNKDNKPIDNIDVESGAPDLGKVYSFNTKNATDTDGTVCFYYPKGTYTVKVMLDGKEAASKEVRMLEDTLKITIKVDTDKTDGGGSGHQGYNGLAPGYSDGVGSDDTPFSEIKEQGQIIRFGSYPQSEVTDVVTRTALHNILDAAEEKNPNVWKVFEYYYDGSMVSDQSIKYIDIYYNGNKYRGVAFSSIRGSQRDNGYSLLNTVYWFLYEPIRWRVLDSASGLILCDSVLDSQAYNIFSEESNGYYYGDSTHSYAASNYSCSSLRYWLTHDFMEAAFSDIQQNKMAGFRVIVLSNGEEKDKVFPLTEEELTSSRYGFNYHAATDPNRQKIASAYAKCMGCSVYNSCGRWWKCGGFESGTAGNVSVRGQTNWHNNVIDESCGVCPAIRLKLGSAVQVPQNIAAQHTQPIAQAQSEGTNAASASGAVAGNEYILLVRKAGTTALTPDNLLYIDQQTGQTGTVTFTYAPRIAAGATVEIIGDFGSGVETRTVADIPQPPVGKVRSVTADDLSLQYKSGGTLQPTVTADSGVKYTVAYSGFDSSIISVDKNGKVTTVKGKTGTTTVTVTATDEYGNTAETKCTVTVKYAWWQMLIRIFLFGWIWY